MPTSADTVNSARRLKVQIEIRDADLLTFFGDGIVVPTISDGIMIEKVAAHIKAAAGQEVEDEVLCSVPIAVGAAVVTGAGALTVRHLIHTPVTEQPGMKIGVESIRRATRAGLLASTHFQMETIAIPGIGYGPLGVPHDEAARAMIDEVRAYRGTHPSLVVLMDTDPEMVAAFHLELTDG
jgi:O-acetyl-ADP-ribose deacetylase